MRTTAIETLPIDQLRSRPRNVRTHSRKQIRQIAESIRRFGFTNPMLIDGENRIVAGHGRVEAAREQGMATAPSCASSTCQQWKCWPTTSSPSTPGWASALFTCQGREASVGSDEQNQQSMGQAVGLKLRKKRLYWANVTLRPGRLLLHPDTYI
jgi:hypothetical protein